QGRKPASVFREVWEADAGRYPRGALRMRFSDNHDERRAIARFGEPAALAAEALMFTLDGVPMLYNGMEAGDTAESGAPALSARLCETPPRPSSAPRPRARPASPTSSSTRGNTEFSEGKSKKAKGKRGDGGHAASHRRRLMRAVVSAVSLSSFAFCLFTVPTR